VSDQLIFDHEKLDLYQIELAFIVWVSPLLSETRSAAQGFYREVCDQLDRASLSFLLNTAEGNGKRQGKQRAKFFDDTRGSALECAACLDALVAETPGFNRARIGRQGSIVSNCRHANKTG
jgi:four helix bundle protein